eukprot:CAMPEP_0117697492 /NCGR_PEP_ID=MMETSP0804-20121206/29261_1 /TAXON_ID=1074897 /ORGANISM="Tetraselmis astigmatica, Strain CCMP880" /LENGTH=749 /DNA_ID=CAMNT_0005511753 /DNA_START=231 /DNA_END=2481 /DNA_ORIENTATION=-
MAPSDTDLTGTDDILLMLLPRGTDADGFSSSSLQLYLENIREKALQVSASLYDCLDAACASNDPLDSATLESLREVLGADKKPEAATLAVVVESHSALARQVKEARARYSGLKAQAGRTQQLLEVAENTKAGRFSAAATALREMEATVSATASSPCDGDGRADSGITAAKRELQEALTNWWKSAVHFSTEAKAVDLRNPDHVLRVPDAWRGFTALGLSSPCAKKLADGLMSAIIKPTVLERGAQVHITRTGLQVTIGKDATAGSPASPLEQVEHICRMLLVVVEFTAGILAAGDNDMSRTLGRNLWPRIVKGLEAKHLAKLAPKGGDRAQLAAFRGAAEAACSLEAKARTLGLCPEAERPIATYVREVLSRFMEQRIQGLLSRGRALVMAPLGGETHTVGGPPGTALCHHSAGTEGSLLSEGAFKVTEMGAELPLLIEAAVAEAAAAEYPDEAFAYCRAAQQLASLLCSLPRVVHAQQLKVVRQKSPCLTKCESADGIAAGAPAAALYHNDCQQVAVRLATLPLAFGPRLEPLLGRRLSFMQAAVALQDEGRAVFNQQLEVQCQQLMELIDKANGFHVHQMAAGLACRKAVNAVVHSLGRLSAVIREVLTTPAFISSAGSLLQASCSRVVHELLSRRDISVDESEELPVVLLPLVEDAPASILGLDGPGAASDWANEALLTALRAAAPAWARLKAAVGLLQARLADIGTMWEAGELQASGLTAAEVKGMVNALFEDTAMRDSVLEKIAL